MIGITLVQPFMNGIVAEYVLVENEVGVYVSAVII
jgi:hypothetical protein